MFVESRAFRDQPSTRLEEAVSVQVTGIDAGPSRRRYEISGTVDEALVERFALFGAAMAAGASSAASLPDICDDGKAQVPLRRIFHVDGRPPHRRCEGHEPPHCFDENDKLSECP